jgi:glycosyltransferase, group 1 family protein
MKEYKDRKLLYIHDGRQYIDKKGVIYGSLNDMIFPLKKRYEYLAPEIWFAQRVVPLRESDRSKYVILKDYGIDVVPIPEVSSIKGMITNTSAAKKALETAIRDSDLLILRNSKNTALAQPIAKKLGKPYIFEVVSCNWDALWNYSLMGKIYAPYAFLRMKYNVSTSRYAMYVTKEFLQRRYPNEHTNIGISDVMIDPIDKSQLEKKIALYSERAKSIILTTCAAIDVRYKGQEYIIRAIARLKDKYDITYHLAGGGSKDYLSEVAKECGVGDRIFFHGLLSKHEVNELLDRTTIYCQPSKQEGLPRAVVEAMSRGCICIASRTGGIPELLDSSMITGRGDVRGFTKLIEKIINDKDLRIKQASLNFNKALEFDAELLDKERKAFYDKFISEN